MTKAVEVDLKCFHFIAVVTGNVLCCPDMLQASRIYLQVEWYRIRAVWYQENLRCGIMLLNIAMTIWLMINKEIFKFTVLMSFCFSFALLTHSRQWIAFSVSVCVTAALTSSPWLMTQDDSVTWLKACRSSLYSRCYMVVQHTPITLLDHRPYCHFAFLKINTVGWTDALGSVQ